MSGDMTGREIERSSKHKQESMVGTSNLESSNSALGEAWTWSINITTYGSLCHRELMVWSFAEIDEVSSYRLLKLV